MRSRLHLALAAAVALTACGRCGKKPAPPSIPPAPRIVDAVASVDGEAIPRAALDRALREVSAASNEVDPAVRQRIVADLVDRLLLRREARRRGLEPSAEELDRELARLRAEYPGPRFDELLAEQDLTADGLRGLVRERLAAERLLAAVSGEVTVADEEVAAFYDANRARYDQAARVRASQIVLRTRDEAERVRGRLRRSPAEFEELARRLSIAPEAAQGGDLGWFGKDSGMPDVFDACLTLPLGRISEVAASPFGFHVFKVVARRPARRQPLSEVSGAIRDQLAAEKRDRAEAEFLAALRARAKIELK